MSLAWILLVEFNTRYNGCKLILTVLTFPMSLHQHKVAFAIVWKLPQRSVVECKKKSMKEQWGMKPTNWGKFSALRTIINVLFIGYYDNTRLVTCLYTSSSDIEAGLSSTSLICGDTATTLGTVKYNMRLLVS